AQPRCGCDMLPSPCGRTKCRRVGWLPLALADVTPKYGSALTPSLPGPSHALNAFLDLLAAYPSAPRFQPVHDVRVVWAPALQAGPAHGGDCGELGDRLHRVLHGGAG